MSDDQVIYCSLHPNVETRLRCSKCGNPICPRCAVGTPVGFRCPQCVRSQQAIFYSATPLDYAIAAVVGLVISTIAAFILGRIGIFLVFILSPVAVEARGTAKFELTLALEESAAGILGELEYNSDLFDTTTMARLLAHFERLLEGAVEDPARLTIMRFQPCSSKVSFSGQIRQVLTNS